MQQIQAPNKIVKESPPRLFLAGSIEMGKADQWQMLVVGALANTPWVILNPRRDDWDSSWDQNIDNPAFFEQVQWELSSLEVADFVLFYFDPKTQAPISLLELGLVAQRLRSTDRVFVVCPDGYWKKGNVDIVCDLYEIEQCHDLMSAINRLKILSKEEVANVENPETIQST